MPCQITKYNNFPWGYWFLAKNLSDFLSLFWKLDNPYYHNWAWPRPSKLIKARAKASDIIKKAWPMTIKGQTRSHKATQARPHQDYIKAYMCYVMFRFCLGLEFKVEDSSMCALYLWSNLKKIGWAVWGPGLFDNQT